MTTTKGECFDCGHNTWRSPQEYYAVTDAVWSMACAVEPKLPDELGMLCVGCLEQRLGRELTRADFKDCGLTRNPRPRSSTRLLDRLSRARSSVAGVRC
jgi:hypothetical protein